MPNYVIEFQNVDLFYGNFQALNNLTLVVEEGEILGLVGPNGAGKTTSIKILVGLLQHDSGTVNVLGQNIVADRTGYKANIGYMPEAPTLPEYLTTSEFLGFVGRIMGITGQKLQDKMSEMMRDLQLGPKANDTIATLSKGMRAKLAFAASIIHEPKILILDEPLIGIDPAGQHLIKDKIIEMARRRSSVLVSTHQLDTAERLCTRVSIIHKGMNLATGSIATLRDQAHMGEKSTLEEVFLKLTEESGMPEPEIVRKKGLFGGLGRK